MLDQVNATLTPHKRLPWTKGELAGAKPPCDPTSGQSGRSFRSRAAFATSPCSIWRSAANFMVTTWRMNGRFAPIANDQAGSLPQLIIAGTTQTVRPGSL